jgi:hypothetical protein
VVDVGGRRLLVIAIAERIDAAVSIEFAVRRHVVTSLQET